MFKHPTTPQPSCTASQAVHELPVQSLITGEALTEMSNPYTECRYSSTVSTTTCSLKLSVVHLFEV